MMSSGQLGAGPAFAFPRRPNSDLAIIGPLAGGILLSFGWNAQSVVLIAAIPALLAGMAVIVLRGREPNVTIVSSAAMVHH
jgi:AAHS family 4-hydroxybenzoate transporter-like MFS transporter